MYRRIHCASCAPAPIGLPSLATLFEGSRSQKRPSL